MKVIVGVDGSKHARWATQWVAALPFAAPPRTTALHVLNLASLRAPFMVQPVVVGNEPFIREEVHRMERQAKRVTADTAALLESLKIPGQVRTINGPVAPTLVEHAGRGCLIVLGARGLGALDRFLLGSVSTQVALHSPCSVLIVKEAPRRLRRIVLATDGSKASDKALRFLLRELQPAAKGQAIEVIVLHVMPFLKYPEVKQAGNALVTRAAARLAKGGYRVQTLTQLGDPAEEIIKVAEHQRADLVVSGAKGLGAVARFLLGSVSTKLAQQSPCSLLIVR
jgi:nucleotide-binding universal stress UspA family protein